MPSLKIDKPIRVKIGTGESQMILMPGEYQLKSFIEQKFVELYHHDLPQVTFVAEISDCKIIGEET